MMRYAKVEIGNAANFEELLYVVQRFLPSNYAASYTAGSEIIFIYGYDSAGWTLDDYVIPRLASGGYIAKEML